MENKSVWDKEKLEQLSRLWAEGLPITKIGLELGVSRNAIAGKAHRLGLPKRNSPISKLGDARKNQAKTVPLDNQKELPLKLLLRNVEWSRNACCWPFGDPKLPGFKFCGVSIVPGRPYCEEHSLLAYTNTRES
jgi:GcrA cell cycle regulator